MIAKKAVSVVAALALGMGTTVSLAAGPAQATFKVGVGGGSKWIVKTKLTTSTSSIKVGGALKVTGAYTFRSHLLGIPMPAKGNYNLAVPVAFNKPTVIHKSLSLTTSTFKVTKSVSTGKKSWSVKGCSSFWGTKSGYVKAKATSKAKGTSYVKAGNSQCSKKCNTTNVSVGVKAKS